MADAPTRIALAGFGAWGGMHARAIRAIEGAELVALFCHGDASAEKAAASEPQARLFRSYGEMLAAGPYDAVSITVPNNLHMAFAVKALAAGNHVFLEKPLGITVCECHEVAAAAQRAGRRVAVNHELRVSHQWGKVRSLIAEGAIGKVVHQHFSLFRHPFRPGSGGWRRDPERVGSWILEEVVHFVDLVMLYARENGLPSKIVAQGSSATGLVDTVSAMIAWPDGSSALVSQCLKGFQHHTLLEIAGSEGAIRTWWSGAMDRTEHPDFALAVKRAGASEVETVAVARSGEIFELEENLRRALASFRGGEEVMSLAEARASIAVCRFIEESLLSGEAVDLTDYWARNLAPGA